MIKSFRGFIVSLFTNLEGVNAILSNYVQCGVVVSGGTLSSCLQDEKEEAHKRLLRNKQFEAELTALPPNP